MRQQCGAVRADGHVRLEVLGFNGLRFTKRALDGVGRIGGGVSGAECAGDGPGEVHRRRARRCELRGSLGKLLSKGGDGGVAQRSRGQHDAVRSRDTDGRRAAYLHRLDGGHHVVPAFKLHVLDAGGQQALVQHSKPIASPLQRPYLTGLGSCRNGLPPESGAKKELPGERSS